MDNAQLMSPADIAFGFVTDGVLGTEEARHILGMDADERAVLAEDIGQIEVVLETDSQHTRLSWLQRQLGRESIDPDVFVQYTTERRITNYRDGLGTSVFTDGRHSSPNTFSSDSRKEK